MAHQAWQICQGMTLFELVLHWITLHERLEEDLQHLKSYTYIKFEEFVNDPDSYLGEVYEAVGLDASKGHEHEVAVKKGKSGISASVPSAAHHLHPHPRTVLRAPFEPRITPPRSKLTQPTPPPTRHEPEVP